MNYTLRVGNLDEKCPVFDIQSTIRLLGALEVDNFIIVEPTESQALNQFFQTYRNNETEFLCEYCDGQIMFRSEPANVSVTIVETCLAAYCLHGHFSDEFQAAARWVQHEVQPELSTEPVTEFADLSSNPCTMTKADLEKWVAESLQEAPLKPEMSGLDFERFVAKSLQDAGWTTRLTRRTGDQGLDLLAFDDEFRVAIQCKRYTEPVSNSAVQEVHAAADVLQATHAVVVVSSRYTDSAIALAATLGVILLTIDQLHELKSHLIFIRPREVSRRGPRLFLDT